MVSWKVFLSVVAVVLSVVVVQDGEFSEFTGQS